MKRISAALLLVLLLIPAISIAYDHGGAYGVFEPRIEAAWLNQKMYTRTGPGTEYSSLGTIGYEGQQIDIFSVTYDRNGVCWVQVSAEVDGLPVRVYTGLKRIDGVDLSYASRDSDYDEVVHTYSAARPLLGPGDHYAAYNFVLPEYTEVRIIQIEYDPSSDEYYTACDFTYKGQLHRGWFPSDIIP